MKEKETTTKKAEGLYRQLGTNRYKFSLRDFTVNI